MIRKYPSTPLGYYVYVLKRQDIPIYVGFGTGDRAHHHEQYARGERDLGFGLVEDYNPFKTRVIRKRLRNGHPIEYEFHSCESREIALELEIDLIAKYGRRGIDPNGTLTNRTLGGSGGFTWAHIRDEYIRKMKQTWADESKRKDMGRKVKQTRIKNGNWAKKWTDEERNRRIPKLREQASKQRKRIEQICIDTGMIIRVWDSGLQASRELGVKQGAIAAAAGGYQNTAAGFRWKYEGVEWIRKSKKS